jgi:hypothetical protein
MKTIEEQIIHLTSEDLEDFKPEVGKIYSGLPNYRYHACADFESSTTINALNITLKHREDMEFKATNATAFGALFHDAMESLRTGVDISDMIGVVDSFGKRSKKDPAEFILNHSSKYGDDLEEIMAEHSRNELVEIAESIEKEILNGKKRVNTESYERSESMVEAVKGHPVAKKLIDLHGHAELSFFSEVEVEIDEQTIPIKVKVRPDDLIEFEDEIWIDDWKTIGKFATDSNIRESLWKWRYDMQAAIYEDIVKRFTDKPVYFRFVFVEKIKPSPEKIRVVQLPIEDIDAGWIDYRKALEKKAKWIIDNKEWKGFDIPEDGIDIIPMRNIKNGGKSW